MRLAILLASCLTAGQAFSMGEIKTSIGRSQVATNLFMSVTETASDTADTPSTKSTKLSVLTFDLDDTLYPIAIVLNEANAAFARAMKRFGYENIEPQDIVLTGKKIRDDMAKTDAEKSATLTHTEIRRLAIREEMEKIEYQRKLQSCADDWATQVSSLSPLVVKNAKK